jgi:four helix bundle protein
METYQDLRAWQYSMDVADAVYIAVKLLPKTETYELGQQMRGAATSMPSNIAEGQGRRTDRDIRHFAIQARGSAYELETQVLIAYRQRFFDARTADALRSKIAKALRAIEGYIEYLDKRIGDA